MEAGVEAVPEVAEEASEAKAEASEVKETPEEAATIETFLLLQALTLRPIQDGQDGLVTQIYLPLGPAGSTGTGASRRTSAWSQGPAHGSSTLIKIKIETGTSP